MRSKLLVQLNTFDGEDRTALARFTLGAGGRVTATYGDELTRAHFEETGIFYRGRVLRPGDGVAFYDALDKVFSVSSRWVVMEDKG